jgi:hypothetical protein
MYYLCKQDNGLNASYKKRVQFIRCRKRNVSASYKCHDYVFSHCTLLLIKSGVSSNCVIPYLLRKVLGEISYTVNNKFKKFYYRYLNIVDLHV